MIGQPHTPILLCVQGRGFAGPVAEPSPADGGQGGGATPATIGAALAEAASALAAMGSDEPRRRARRLVAAALGLSPTEVFAHPERPVTAAEAGRIAAILGRMQAHEPLSRILGAREFWGREFALSPDVLDPRPETETVVEAVLARLPDKGRTYRFLDLGTGSGCLLLALLSEYPAAYGLGIDCAPGAASVAHRNADRLDLRARAQFVVADWAAPVSARFDAIVANPPYIPRGLVPNLPPEVRDYDPLRALDGGADGLAAYRAIAAQAPRLLLPGGLLAAEIGAGQGPAVAAMLRASGLAVEAAVPDLAGIERCVVARRPE